MSWQTQLLNVAGPSILPGIRSQEWLRLLANNHFKIGPRYLPRALTISGLSLVNSFASLTEELYLGSQLDEVDVPAPLFVIGHWRSGTTFAHQLLALDPQFAAPTLADVLFPSSCLTLNPLLTKLATLFLPPQRPSDRTPLAFDSAYEDEFANCVRSLCSAQLSMLFPQREVHYDRYVTLSGCTLAEVKVWQETLLWLTRKLTLKYGRPLILKSPAHTGRMRLILQLFPNARFVHIARNPWDVFRSTRRTMRRSLNLQQLQSRASLNFTDRVLRQYSELYEAYFEDREVLSPGQLCELRFEDILADPINQLMRIYDELTIPEFHEAEPHFANSLQPLRPPCTRSPAEVLTPFERSRIALQWQRCFAEWGYSLTDDVGSACTTGDGVGSPLS